MEVSDHVQESSRKTGKKQEEFAGLTMDAHYAECYPG